MATTTSTIIVTADTRQAERALGSVTSALKGLVGAAALSSLAKKFIELADAGTNLQNKMALVTQEGQTSNQLFMVMAKSAFALGAPLKDVGDLFFRVANNTKDLGLAQTDQVKITETLIKGFQLTGATMGETQGAIIQLGQAFATGTLRGDELNSVLESLPMVSDALAAKFGVQRGALKALGEQGKITSKDLSDAILASGQAIDTAWGNRLPTVQQSFTRLGTVVDILTKRFDEQNGVSAALSYALLIVADAVISVYEWFQKWGKVISFLAEAFLYLYAPLRIAKFAFAALIGPIETIIGIFRGGAGVISSIGAAFTRFAEKLFPINDAVSVLGMNIAKFFAGVAAGASAIGLGSLVQGIKNLFSDDKRTAAEKYNQKLAEINKRIGLDQVEASKRAQTAAAALSAEQVKNAGIIEKANKDRNSELKKMLRDQNEELVLTKFIGDELSVQTAIYQANKSLIKDIKNDKGDIIGQTKGLTSLEEAELKLLTLQSIELKRQQDIRQKLTAYKVPLKGSAAGSEVAGQMPNLDPITAAQTANQTMFSGLEYLRQQDLISEQAYQAAKVNAAVTAQTAIMEANKKQFEAAALLRIQEQTGTTFNFETQKQMAAEAAAFEMKTATEKAAWSIETGASIFSALGAQNKKAFEAAKAFNIAQALMNTYMGATKALATYPWPFGLGAAALAVAAGMAQVNSIRSQTYSGRALGGPVMGGNPYIVGENGPELFTPNTTGSITRNGDLGGGGVTNVNFTILANDAQGFDDLLAQRKGMITQMVNDAMVEKGQRM